MQLTILRQWFTATFTELAGELRWSFAPPLMVYLAAGLQGLSAIVATFFRKGLPLPFGGVSRRSELLGRPALGTKDAAWPSRRSHLALESHSRLPWCRHYFHQLTDYVWPYRAHTDAMRAIMPAEAWFVLSTLLTPIGYVIQDVVADAMTVEAVPVVDEKGNPLPEDKIKAQHTTMQMLGRFAIILGLVIVAVLNITMFSGIKELPEARQVDVYATIYLIALIVPVVSVAGVLLNQYQLYRRRAQLLATGMDAAKIDTLLFAAPEETKPNWWIFGGTAAFAAFTITMGLSRVSFAQEIIFLGSAGIIVFLMSRLMRELEPDKARMLVGTALIIFIFRAVPLPGPGLTWFEIDVLGFDQQFLSILSLITALLTLVGMVVLRPLMAHRSIAYIVVLLTIAAAILSLPNIGLYYGVHEWTSRWTAGVVDARFIAILDTAIESPLGQIAMIPMLAWIARNAPPDLKATFFAVMASFVNLALSASSLFTKYINQIYLITREVKDKSTGAIQIPADYSLLGWLLITVALIAAITPLVTVYFVQKSRFNTSD